MSHSNVSFIKAPRKEPQFAGPHGENTLRRVRLTKGKLHKEHIKTARHNKALALAHGLDGR